MFLGIEWRDLSIGSGIRPSSRSLAQNRSNFTCSFGRNSCSFCSNHFAQLCYSNAPCRNPCWLMWIPPEGIFSSNVSCFKNIPAYVLFCFFIFLWRFRTGLLLRLKREKASLQRPATTIRQTFNSLFQVKLNVSQIYKSHFRIPPINLEGSKDESQSEILSRLADPHFTPSSKWNIDLPVKFTIYRLSIIMFSFFQPFI